jgi:hypothetical protein
VNFFIPGRYFAQIPAAPAATVAAPRTTAVVPVAPATPASAAPEASWSWLAALFAGLGGAIALAVGVIMFRVARPRREPVVYQPPEIELETFERPGLVPDLDAIEAALYIGNKSKVIVLIVLALAERGILNIVNRQLPQLKSGRKRDEDYEQALVTGIADDARFH